MKAYCMKKAGQVFRKTKVAAATLCVGAAGFAAVGPVWAQNSRIDVAPSEKAKRDAEKVFSWMKMSTDPKKPGAQTPTPTTATASAAPAARDDRATAQKPVVAKRAEPAADPRALALAETLSSDPPAAGSAAAAPVAATTMAATMPSLAATVAPTSASAGALAATLAVPPESLAKIPTPMMEDLVPLLQSEPNFPQSLMAKLRQGRVQVTFDVRQDGTVGDVQVTSTSSSRLNSFAIAAVQEWKFKPIARSRQASVELGFDLD